VFTINTQFGEKPILDRIFDLIESTLARKCVYANGIAAPGPVDPYEGIIIQAQIFRMERFTN
jgi:hypothetical protein